ncbi:alpha/beta fold hydrolase, partial [Leucobacter sp. M11]|uniref:alpha/beta fold hydrolase n=1 Tax=Leucobacter sp. M11 TaxID=2993565 RepID=UPI002D804977
MTNGPRAESAPGSLPTPAWERRRAALMKHPDVAIVPRDLPGGRTLPLARVRSGPRGSNPVLVLPGGPGLASVQPYRGFRTAAARRGRDVLMVEHRGVGLSRKTDDGSDLRPEDITIDGVLADLLAVLDAEGIERVCVAGSSYGSYLAGAFGARHPERVRAMILDSPVLDATSTREATRALNRLYWFGTEETAPHAARIRALAERDVIAAADGFPLQLLHESGGPALVAGMLDLLEQGRGHRLWSWLTRLGAADVMTVRPFLMEFDLVARAAFTELG